MRLAHIITCVAAVTALLAGCGASNTANSGTSSSSPGESAPATHYTAPPFAPSVYNEAAAVGEAGVLIDTSNSADGYVAVSAVNEKRLKFQVVMGEIKYNYDLPGDGVPVFFPLQSGSGTYKLRVMQNVTESKYTPICEAELTAEIASDTAPFVRPNQYVSYTEVSASTVKAAELAGTAEDDAGVVANVYAYVSDTIKYDTELADSIKNLGQYLPSPDATLASGKGICLDYASLAAAMLRSQGIPTKLITGYVAPNDVYHAWNMIWLEGEGWITVKIKAPSHSWERIDLTFAAGGVDPKYVGDGTNYVDSLVY